VIFFFAAFFFAAMGLPLCVGDMRLMPTFLS
jgi:hypothetical protein